MNFVKREKWTEADVDALPPGEHDYFDRKSGALFTERDRLFGALAKACSAFANSGGGHLILGVDDSGIPHGVPTQEGSTSIRDWLEQKIPNLVVYPLSDFRVHVVQRSNPSRIPPDRQVVVIDIGDSGLAPHQCAYGGGDARKYIYYYRQAGRSEPAPHFYLELLRQRLVNPVLEARLAEFTPQQARRSQGSIFLAAHLQFLVENVGRVAAYKWQLQMLKVEGCPEERLQDYKFRVEDYPPDLSRAGAVRDDDTILPGCALDDSKPLGVFLRPSYLGHPAVRAEIDRLLSPLIITFRLATETSPGETKQIGLGTVLNVDQLADFLMS